MPPLYVRVAGYYRIKIDDKYKTRLQNLLFSICVNAYLDEKGNFYIAYKDKSRLLAAAKKERLSLSVSELLGLPGLLRLHKHRVGIPLGVLLSILILLWGSNTVWRVEVSGNESVSAEAIVRGLAEEGFGIGSSTKNENYDGVITAYRLLHPEIAWMGIYTQGTTAYVRVIENNVENDKDIAPSPAHLVASMDALIVRLDIAHGTAVVKPGCVVKKGDALVLGHVPGAHVDTVLAAEGEVIGRVSENFVVEIPYVQKEKQEKERKIIECALIFFEKTINIFKKTGKSPFDYVIIERKESITLPNGLSLPIGYVVREKIAYEESELLLEKGEAILQGMELLEQKIRAAVGTGELLSRSVRVEEREDACVLYATVEYTKNIAEGLPFTVS